MLKGNVMNVLTKGEIANLNRGKKRKIEVEVCAYTKIMIFRNPQTQKNKCIYEFAVKFLNMLRKHEATTDDKRHIRNLIKLLQKEM